MSYILIPLFALTALLLLWLGFSFQGKKLQLGQTAALPSEERAYWEGMNKKIAKGFFIGAAGGGLTAASLALMRALLAEVGCITLMAAMVFSLAILCRKTSFTASPETERIQKRWKFLFLVASFAALFMTQWVFQFFNMQ